jgi:peptidoglycan hydrolase CwlO-like protein
MTPQLTTILLCIFSVFGTNFATWFFTRKKVSADTKGSEIDNVNKALVIWRETSEAIEKWKNDLQGQVDTLMGENRHLKGQVTLLIEQNQKLKNQIEGLEKALNCTRGENKKLLEELKKFNNLQHQTQ